MARMNYDKLNRNRRNKPGNRTYRMSKNSVIRFGKYKDKRLSWIADNDNDYLKWLINEGIIAC